MKYIVYNSLEADCEESFIFERDEFSLDGHKKTIKLWCDDCFRNHLFIAEAVFERLDELWDFLKLEEKSWFGGDF